MPSYRVRVRIWVGVILFVVVPWATFKTHSHWGEVRWVPFVSPPIKIRDIVANVLLYVPFGYWYSRAWPERRRRAGWYGLGLTLVTEFSQVYSHGRFPSTTDVSANVIGAWLGVALASRVLSRTAHRPVRPSGSEAEPAPEADAAVSVTPTLAE